MRRASLSDQAVAAARQVLAGQRGGLRAYLIFAGPAVIASIAYMDPGNFATNIQAGAKYGYGLLWVVLLANLIAMLFQALSAKLGIVTGRNLAEIVSRPFSAAGGLGDVGGQRDCRDGDRSGGVPGRRYRAFPAVPDAAPRRHGRDRDRDLRPADVPGLRFPADRTDHRRDGEHHCALLPRRNVHRAGRTGPRRHSTPVTPQLADAGGAAALRRHHRRDRHAACGLSAFRPDPGAHACA